MGTKNYLNYKSFSEIKDNVSLFSITELGECSHYFFDSGIEEYNSFFDDAIFFEKLNISRTFVVKSNITGEIIGYFSLAADSIKLSQEEKFEGKLDGVPYKSIPAIKIGKLAINKKLSPCISRKGYGSFLIGIAEAIAANVNRNGVACRFLTVDADVEYNVETTVFYEKNGFCINQSNKSRGNSKTVSMRKDILT